MLHARAQPYAKKYQNRLELVLIVSSACAVALSLSYPYLEDDAARTAVDVFVLLLMFGPLVALLIWWGKRRFDDARTPRAINLHELTSSWALQAASSREDSRSRPKSPAQEPKGVSAILEEHLKQGGGE